MKYEEAQRLANEARTFADWIEQHGPQLPGHPSVTIEARCWLTESNYNKLENGEYETVLNEDGTKANLAEFLTAVGSCEKDYQDDRLTVVKKFGKTAKIFGSVDRSLTCKKKIIGKKVIPAYSSPEKEVDDYEWECDDAPACSL